MSSVTGESWIFISSSMWRSRVYSMFRLAQPTSGVPRASSRTCREEEEEEEEEDEGGKGEDGK